MATSLPSNLQVISVMISVLSSLSVSVQALPLLLGRLYSPLPLPLRPSHVKVLINCSPAALGGCAGPGRPAFILTSLVPGPVTLEGYDGPDRLLATVMKKVLCDLPPPCLHPAPGLLGVEFLLPLPPPHPLTLLNGSLVCLLSLLLWPSQGR